MKYLVLALLCVSVTLAAQEVPRVDLFGGYSYLNIDTNDLSSRQSAHGWESSVSANITRHFAVEGGVSGYYKSYDIDLTAFNLGTVHVPVRDYAFVGGPRFNFRPAFVHALVGLDRLSANAEGYSAAQNSFAAAFGGGVQWKVVPHISVRASADYVLTRHNIFGGDRFTQNNFRAVAGFVYSIGGIGERRAAVAYNEQVPSAAVPIPAFGLKAMTTQAGASIVEVIPNSLAAQAGFKAGDVINLFNGQQIKTALELAAASSTLVPGSQVKLGYMVNGYWQSETTILVASR